MHPKCRTQLNQARVQAGGAPLTDAQAAKIEGRLRGAALMLAAKDPDAWRALPVDQRTLLAAQQAAADIASEAARKVANAQRQALKTAETEIRTGAGNNQVEYNINAPVSVQAEVAIEAIIDTVARVATFILIRLPG